MLLTVVVNISNICGTVSLLQPSTFFICEIWVSFMVFWWLPRYNHSQWRQRDCPDVTSGCKEGVTLLTAREVDWLFLQIDNQFASFCKPIANLSLSPNVQQICGPPLSLEALPHLPWPQILNAKVTLMEFVSYRKFSTLHICLNSICIALNLYVFSCLMYQSCAQFENF